MTPAMSAEVAMFAALARVLAIVAITRCVTVIAAVATSAVGQRRHAEQAQAEYGSNCRRFQGGLHLLSFWIIPSLRRQRVFAEEFLRTPLASQR